MTAATHPSSLSQRTLAWVLVGLVLLVSTLITQRGYLMLVYEGHTVVLAQGVPNASDHPPHVDTPDPGHPTASHGSTAPGPSKPHNHAKHCPLCFMHWVTGSMVGDWGVTHSSRLPQRLWLEAALTRDEFLERIAARGPPR